MARPARRPDGLRTHPSEMNMPSDTTDTTTMITVTRIQPQLAPVHGRLEKFIPKKPAISDSGNMIAA